MERYPFSVRIKRQVLTAAVVATLIALYLPFRAESWSMYLALSGAYTVLVFGLLWSDGTWRKYITDNRRTARDLAQGHARYVLALLLWIWICRYAKYWLPDWVLIYAFILSGVGIVAIWWAEQSWLTSQAKKEELIDSSTQLGIKRDDV